MIKKVNHIGIVVKSIDATLELMEKAFGAKEILRMPIPQAGQTSSLVQIGDDSFELMEPLGEGGVVEKYLETHGEGLHHISLVSDDLDADCDLMSNLGIKIFGKASLENLSTAFTHPKTTNGVLYEISQTK